MDSDPAQRNVLGLDREASRAGARRHRAAQVRPAGHRAAGRGAHSSVVDRARRCQRAALRRRTRDRILSELPIAKAIVRRTLKLFKAHHRRLRRRDRELRQRAHHVRRPGRCEGNLQLYDGILRFRDAEGKLVASIVERRSDYQQVHRRGAFPHSYLKAPYFKPIGYPEGIYRVGPLARLNVADRCGTPEADAELAEFRQRFGRIVAERVPLPLRPADRGAVRRGAHGAAARTIRDILDTHVRAYGRRECARRRRHHRGAARRADPSLQGGREGRHDSGPT